VVHPGKKSAFGQAVIMPKSTPGTSLDLSTIYKVNFSPCRAPTFVITEGMTEFEVNAFDHFRLKTVRHLPGSSWTLSWERLALQMGHHEPAVTHAAIALGSIHRALQDDQHGFQHEFALQQYNKAMTYVRKHIVNLDEHSSDADVEVVLLVSLLFFCFEVLHAEDVRATIHLHTSLRILYERLQKPNKQGLRLEDGVERREVIMPTAPKNNMDVLVQTFVRLDGDITIVGEDEPYLSPVCLEKLPSSFYSLEEAMVHLDALASKAHDMCRSIALLAEKLVQRRADYAFLDEHSKSCLACAYSRTINLDSRPDLLMRMQEVKRGLQNWMSALTNVSTTAKEQSAHLLTQIHFFHVWFMVLTWRDEDEMAVDRFDSQFEHILGQAEQYVDLHWSTTTPEKLRDPVKMRNASTRQAFTLGTDLVPCLAAIAFKSRTSAIRRRSVNLLRTINLQGVFDNHFLASFMEQVWFSEEARARALTGKLDGEDFLCHEIPAEARWVEIELSPMQYKRNFYKADVGRLITVALDPNGVLQPDEMIFQIYRPPRVDEMHQGHLCTRDDHANLQRAGWAITAGPVDDLTRPTSFPPCDDILQAQDQSLTFENPSPPSDLSSGTLSISASPESGISTSFLSYEDGTRRVRRVRGHMPCCCNQPHGVDHAGRPDLKATHEKEFSFVAPTRSSYDGAQTLDENGHAVISMLHASGDAMATGLFDLDEFPQFEDSCVPVFG